MVYTVSVTYDDEGNRAYEVEIDGGHPSLYTYDEALADETAHALNTWRWLKENLPTNMKMWGFLPANYCLNCKREHDDGDCYA